MENSEVPYKSPLPLHAPSSTKVSQITETSIPVKKLPKSQKNYHRERSKNHCRVRPHLQDIYRFVCVRNDYLNRTVPASGRDRHVQLAAIPLYRMIREKKLARNIFYSRPCSVPSSVEQLLVNRLANPWWRFTIKRWILLQVNCSPLVSNPSFHIFAISTRQDFAAGKLQDFVPAQIQNFLGRDACCAPTTELFLASPTNR